MLPGDLFGQSVKQSLRFGLDLLSGIKPASFQLQFHFWKSEEVTGCQISGVRWAGDDNSIFFLQKLLGEDGSMRRVIVMAMQTGLFSPNVIARVQAVAAKLRSRTRNSQFGLLGPVLRATTTAV
jgi:hypothetical protein